MDQTHRHTQVAVLDSPKRYAGNMKPCQAARRDRNSKSGRDDRKGGESAQEVAELMEECRIGALVVTTSDFVAGLLTHCDLTKGLARLGGKLATTPVKELMQHYSVSVSPEESTTAVMALMTRRRATHLPVMDRGRLLGIASIGDVVKDRLHDLEIVASVRRGAHVVMH